MTPTEMEEAIRNLQLQATRIEQFLPNLATRGELFAVRDALRVEIQDARRHAVILNEASRDEIKLLAENLARVEATMVTKEDLKAIGGLGRVEATMATKVELRAAIGGLEEKLKEAIGGLERTLSAQLGELASQIATLAKRRKN
jgi:hypothetical protein